MALFLFAGVTQAQQTVFMVVTGEGESQTSTPYTTLDLAVKGAAAGSTIYLPTGSFDVEATEQTIGGANRAYTLFINKKLKLIGAGVDGGALHSTVINGDIAITGAASGTVLEGISLAYTALGGYMRGAFHVNNVDVFIKRCKIGGEMALSGTGDVVISESHIATINGKSTFYGGNGLSDMAVVAQNTVITGNIGYVHNSLFTNNVIGTYSIYDVHSSTFSNNIFTYVGNINPSSYSTYNSYTYNVLVANFDAVTAGSYCTVEDNIPSNTLAEIFEGGTAAEAAAREYRLNPEGPAKVNAEGNPPGSDGTEIGLYGGLGYKGVRTPSNPSVTKFSVGGTTNPDGLLKANIVVDAQEK